MFDELWAGFHLAYTLGTMAVLGIGGILERTRTNHGRGHADPGAHEFDRPGTMADLRRLVSEFRLRASQRTVMRPSRPRRRLRIIWRQSRLPVYFSNLDLQSERVDGERALSSLPGTMNERGQGAMEYGLAIIAIAVVVIVILVIYGAQIQAMYETLVDVLRLVFGS